MPVADVAPLLALVGGAVAVLLVAMVLPRRRQGLLAPLAIVVLGVSAYLAVRLWRDVPERLTFQSTWALDGVTAWTTCIIAAMTAFVAVFSPAWFRTDRRHGEWYAVLLFSAAGSLVLAGAADTMELLVGMLLVSVTGYTLASYHRDSRMSAEAGAKYFFIGALTNPLLFLGVVFLYGATGTTNYAGIAAALAAGGDPIVLSASVALVLLGVSFELGAVPVHPWVPDVSQGGPVPAAAFLTVVPKVGALVAISRFVALFPEASVGWRPLVAAVAALTMTMGNLAALGQNDVRRLLGWSSVSQAGYGLMAVVALGRSALAVPSLMLFLVAYAVANGGAFAVVAALRGRTRLHDFRGLSRRRPMHATVLALAMLSLVGIPPLVGFTAKLGLFGATIDAGYGWLALLAVANTVASVFYYLRVIGPMVFAEPPEKIAVLDRASSGAVFVAGGLTVALGVGAGLLLDSAPATLLP